MRAFCLAIASLWVLASLGCSSGGGGTSSSHEAWTLTLTRDGVEHTLDTEIMNIFLTEDESYPEIFDMRGTAFRLVGELPASVGYEENFEALFAKAVKIDAEGGDPREAGMSFLQLPGESKWRVVGGTWVPEKRSGKMEGLDGDITLTGRIMLQVETGAGVETLTGILSIHVVTWG